MPLRFSKMHGAGNDFVVIDCRKQPFALDADAIRLLGDRHFGIGFDQLLTIEPARDPSCAYAYGIWNTDGTRSGQCGNGLRCVARWLARERLIGAGLTWLESPSGPVGVELSEGGDVRANMGEPRFAPDAIPLLAVGEAAQYRIEVDGREVAIGAVSMGNPHAVIEVDSVERAPVSELGPGIEGSADFPRGCNVGFAQVLARDAIALRVWERGVGETLACGSGACAAVAVLRLRDRVDDDVRVALPGGELRIHWRGPGHPLWMSGPATFVFEGECSV